MRKFLLVGLTSVMILMLAACGGEKDEAGKVVISGKQFTEQIILTHIMGEYLKANTDLEVEIEEGLGSVFILQEAMEKGDIDMYVEYTGTAFENIIEEEFDPSLTTEEIYELTRDSYEEEFDMTWLEPLGFNNTFTLAMRNDLYEELGTETYTDLTDHTADLNFGAAPEVFERDDGYDGLIETYGFDEFSDKVIIDPDLIYEAANDGDLDIIIAFATEARIDEFNLKVLEDDQGYFPPYDAGIVIRQEVLDANPDLEDELNKLAGSLSDERMRELNGRVSEDGKQDKEVAIEFLEEEGFID